MVAVVGGQLGRHRLHLAAEEHVQEERVDDVVAVVAQRDLVGAQLLGRAVDHAAAQARAQRARRLALGHLLLDDRIRVRLDDHILHAQLLQVVGQHLFRKARLLLIEVHRDQFEIDRRALLQRHQHRQHRVRILAAGQAHEDGVAVFNHVEVADGAANLRLQSGFEAVEIIGKRHGISTPPALNNGRTGVKL